MVENRFLDFAAQSEPDPPSRTLVGYRPSSIFRLVVIRRVGECSVNVFPSMVQGKFNVNGPYGPVLMSFKFFDSKGSFVKDGLRAEGECGRHSVGHVLWNCFQNISEHVSLVGKRSVGGRARRTVLSGRVRMGLITC